MIFKSLIAVKYGVCKDGFEDSGTDGDKGGEVVGKLEGNDLS